MDTNLLIQYTIVGVLLLGVCVWIIIKVTRNVRGKATSCCGCALREACNHKQKTKPPTAPDYCHTTPEDKKPKSDHPCPHCNPHYDK